MDQKKRLGDDASKYGHLEADIDPRMDEKDKRARELLQELKDVVGMESMLVIGDIKAQPGKNIGMFCLVDGKPMSLMGMLALAMNKNSVLETIILDGAEAYVKYKLDQITGKDKQNG